MSTWYVDVVNGNSGYGGRGFWAVGYDGASGTLPVEDEVATGATSGSTAKVAYVSSTEWSAGSGTIYFYSRSAAFNATTEQLNFGTGGGHCHTTNTHRSSYDLMGAARQLTGDFSSATTAPDDTFRIAKTADPVSLGITAQWVDGSDTVVLSSAKTKNIDLCAEVGTGTNEWEASTNVTVAKNATYYRQGSQSITITPAAAFGTGLMAWADLPDSTDSEFGSYTGFSCVMRTSGADIPANTLRIRLYSAVNGGGSLLEEYLIPVIIEDTRWVPIVYSKGSALSSTRVRSVGIYADSDPGTTAFQIDNIIAHDESLHHRHLISKYTSGTNECWWAIRSINGTSVALGGQGGVSSGNKDLYVADAADSDDETVTTYTLLPQQIPTLSSSYSSFTFFIINESGGPTSSYTFSGGWNTVSGSIDGLSAYDGLNSQGAGFSSSSYSLAGIILKKLLFTRFYYGIGAMSMAYVTLEDVYVASTQSNSVTISALTATRFYQTGLGAYCQAGDSYLDSCKLYNSDAVSAVAYTLQLSGRVICKDCDLGYSAANYLLQLYGASQGHWFYNCRFKLTGTGTILTVSSSFGYAGKNFLASIDHNQVSGAIVIHLPYYRGYYATHYKVERDAVVGKTAAPSIKLTPGVDSSSYLAESAPWGEGVEVAVAEDGDFTISVWVKRATAVTKTISLVCRKNEFMGIAADTVIDSTTDDTTDWQELSGLISDASIVPPRDGILEFIVTCYGTTSDYINIDDWSVS